MHYTGLRAKIRSLGTEVWLLGENHNKSSSANGFHKQGSWRG
jgi:hypothetical protein